MAPASTPKSLAQGRTLGLGGLLAILTVDTRRCRAADRERTRDDLAAWLAAHNLHLGGDLPVVVIYSPESDSRSLSWRALRRWLGIRLDGRHHLEFAHAEMVLSPEQCLAALEAVACAQMALAEISLTCNLDLQHVASALPTRAAGRS